jgi:hypothetical protein
VQPEALLLEILQVLKDIEAVWQWEQGAMQEEGEVVLVVAAAVTVAANTIAARVIHMSDINAADFGTVGNVASETMTGARGE